MKTLVTISHPELRKTVLGEEALELLSSFSEADWVGEGETYRGPPLEEIIQPYDAVISGWGAPPVTREVLNKADNLRFFGHAAGTVQPYLDPSAYDRGICVVNANSMLAASTAEFTLALFMSAAWDLTGFRDKLRAGIWSDNFRQTVTGLEGQTVGIIGLGEISRRVIELLRPWHTEILLYSAHCPADEAGRLGVTPVSLEELLTRSGIISVHCTLNDTTRDMIGSRELALISDGALLVNTARAAVIREDALYKELSSGRIRAALDVFHEEPLSSASPLPEMENVICLPHIGGFSHFWKSRLGLSVIRDMEKWMNGGTPGNMITREQFHRLTPV